MNKSELIEKLEAVSNMKTHFPLDRVWLCCDCDTVFEMGQDACPNCTSQSFVSLESMLERA